MQKLEGAQFMKSGPSFAESFLWLGQGQDFVRQGMEHNLQSSAFDGFAEVFSFFVR